ncbi:SBDS protein C-terminal domain-containing protein [Kalaharituber pfeilii]|nr:SBDS protein C-terminal domain-containing protein [Kalaharituber pfeilii]
MVNINQPSNQIKLTNVSIVRIKRLKKRFELACYKNKVLEYRSGTEKDLDEVLQIPQVFSNVSKGAVAPTADLRKAFPGMTNEEIILEILKKGELQVGEKERERELEMLKAEVYGLVAGKCVEPGSRRVYTVSMIEKALGEVREKCEAIKKAQSKDNEAGEGGSAAAAAVAAGKEKDKEIPMWHGVTTSRPAKAQALEAIKALVYHQPIPIARARMRIRVHIPASVPGVTGAQLKKMKQDVQAQFEVVTEVDEGGGGMDWECVGFVEPGKFKDLAEVVGKETKGKGGVDVLDMADVREGEEEE